MALRDLGGEHVVTGQGSEAVRRSLEIMHATFKAISKNPLGSGP